jgi:hypothetical protein
MSLRRDASFAQSLIRTAKADGPRQGARARALAYVRQETRNPWRLPSGMLGPLVGGVLVVSFWAIRGSAPACSTAQSIAGPRAAEPERLGSASGTSGVCPGGVEAPPGWCADVGSLAGSDRSDVSGSSGGSITGSSGSSSG